MNLRPLGYEPNELPDCSTSRLEGVVYHADVAAEAQSPALARVSTKPRLFW